MMVKLIAHVLVHSGGDFCLFSVRKLKEDNPTFIQLTGIFLVVGLKRVNFRETELLENVLKKRELGQTAVLSNFFTKIVNWIPLRIRSLTRLVYKAEWVGEKPIIRLDPEEHTHFKWVTMDQVLEEEKLVPYLREIFERLRNDL